MKKEEGAITFSFWGGGDVGCLATIVGLQFRAICATDTPVNIEHCYTHDSQ